MKIFVDESEANKALQLVPWQVGILQHLRGHLTLLPANAN